MTLTAPARRLASRCIFCQTLPLRPAPTHTQRRLASSDSNESSSNPILDKWRAENPSTPRPAQQQQQQMPQQGDIASSSIFEDDRRISEQRGDNATPKEEGKTSVGGIQRDPRTMARLLHPDPNARSRWERKKVIQMVKRGGRLSRPEFLKRTEREHLVKSHNIKTSIKKLGMIARQIAGKTVEDAIVQMRFSKKKVAQEVLKQLEFARDEAVVMRGMGLSNASRPAGAKVLNESSENVTGTASAALELAKGASKGMGPVEIQLKDGKRYKIEDPSKIYIDQAWVGRGPYGQLPDYRARGRVFIMRTPWTSLSVVLKEEATRIREHEEREAKRRKKVTEKVWVPLPDRPIQVQRQWYSW